MVINFLHLLAWEKVPISKMSLKLQKHRHHFYCTTWYNSNAWNLAFILCLCPNQSKQFRRPLAFQGKLYPDQLRISNLLPSHWTKSWAWSTVGWGWLQKYWHMLFGSIYCMECSEDDPKSNFQLSHNQLGLMAFHKSIPGSHHGFFDVS